MWVRTMSPRQGPDHTHATLPALMRRAKGFRPFCGLKNESADTQGFGKLRAWLTRHPSS